MFKIDTNSIPVPSASSFPKARCQALHLLLHDYPGKEGLEVAFKFFDRLGGHVCNFIVSVETERAFNKETPSLYPASISEGNARG